MRWKAVLSALILGVLFLGLSAIAFSAHGDWTDHYKDATGITCCMTGRDCTQAQGRMLTRDGEHIQVEIQGSMLWLPQGSVHVSEDGAFWVCRRGGTPDGKFPLTSADIRCVFYGVGG